MVKRPHRDAQEQRIIPSSIPGSGDLNKSKVDGRRSRLARGWGVQHGVAARRAAICYCFLVFEVFGVVSCEGALDGRSVGPRRFPAEA